MSRAPCMKIDLNFQMGGGGGVGILEKNPFCRGSINIIFGKFTISVWFVCRSPRLYFFSTLFTRYVTQLSD